MNIDQSNQVLRVVIAFDDVGAGERAMGIIADLARGWGSNIRFRSLPWFFDLRSEWDWNEVATSDEIQADILLIAIGASDPWPPAGQWWEDDPSRREQVSHSAVVAQLELGTNAGEGASAQRAAIQSAAQAAGLSFFMPALRDEHDRAIARIHQRAEMVTPVLQEILHHAD